MKITMLNKIIILRILLRSLFPKLNASNIGMTNIAKVSYLKLAKIFILKRANDINKTMPNKNIIRGTNLLSVEDFFTNPT